MNRNKNGHPVYKNVFFLLGFFLLTACQPAEAVSTAETPSPVPACSTPGITQRLSLDSASRGYAYAYLVYLPPCYDTSPTQRYPVLYLVPGRGSGPEAWFSAGLAELADEMILKQEIPALVIVTTENTDGDMYAEAIQNDLVPYIENTYRIRPERQFHAVAGGSLGGIAAYRIGLPNPAHFSSIALFGSGAVSGEEPQLEKWLSAIPPENSIRFFLDCGTGDPLMLERSRALASMLEQKSIPYILHIGDGEHTYNYWITNFPQYLRWLAEDWH